MLKLNCDSSNDKKYEVEAIGNNVVNASKKESYLLGLYYLIIWKGYPKKNIRQHL